jgi:N-glycosylase/DNA lyase
MASDSEIVFPVADYDLDATFTSGQVFGWQRTERGWSGVVNGRWVELSQELTGIRARLVEPAVDWNWLNHFLQADLNLPQIIATFPRDDEHLAAAVLACRGLRLLRQDPWECLASFILSSTKQIVQIRQIVRMLSERHGQRIAAGDGSVTYAFPSAEQIAALTEAELRACKMGFRAPYLLAAARRVAAGEINLSVPVMAFVGAALALLAIG